LKARVFFDTNVLLYADDEDAGKKRDRAREVIAEALGQGNGVVSTQVLQEYFVNATRKLGLDPAKARSRLEIYLSFEVISVRVEHILAAVDLHRLRAISFWDALVATCASESGCERLLTEDLQHGAKLDRVLVENPFLGSTSPGRGPR
jgi:predicted nucleic acid-binding protein